MTEHEFANAVSEQAAQIVSNNIDSALRKFLNQNGYKIDVNIPLTEQLKQIEKIQQDLASKGLFLDYINFTLPYNYEYPSSIHVKTVVIPFFNSIAHPTNKQELLKIAKEKYIKGELEDANS